MWNIDAQPFIPQELEKYQCWKKIILRDKVEVSEKRNLDIANLAEFPKKRTRRGKRGGRRHNYRKAKAAAAALRGMEQDRDCCILFVKLLGGGVEGKFLELDAQSTISGRSTCEE